MKKVILPEDIRALLEKEKSFFDRACFKIFTANSHEEALHIHAEEKAALIITRLDMPEMSSETFCNEIRKDTSLRKVSIIIVCNDTKEDIERCSQSKANTFLVYPINPASLLERAHQLLNIAKREFYRVLLSLKIDGRYKNMPFLCRSENISASGMLIESDRLLDKGDIVTCSFFLPNSVQIISDGEVVRIVKRVTEFDTNQYGIRFTNISSEARSALEDFVEKQCSDQLCK